MNANQRECAAVATTFDEIHLRSFPFIRGSSSFFHVPRKLCVLLAEKQILDWTASSGTASRDPKSLPGLVVDDSLAELTGEWTTSTAIAGYVGRGFRHDGNADKGKKSAKFIFEIAKPGRYDARIGYTADRNRATNVPVTISAADGEKTIHLNQREKPTRDGFHSVGEYRFEKTATITISNASTDGYVIADAVQLVLVDSGR